MGWTSESSPMHETHHCGPPRPARLDDGRPPWSAEGLEARLRAFETRYHIHHEFHRRMNEEGVSRAALQAWVANRWYYQIAIPRKDAAVLANCPDREARRLWVQRMLDQDGRSGEEGGLEAWLRLGEAVGLDRDTLRSQSLVLPGVRFAVDAYVSFARCASWQEAACASLTELFAPTIHRRRLDTWPRLYPWIEPAGYDYFRRRLAEARRDVEHGLRVTLEHFVTRAQQEYALRILQFKLDVLWSLLDALWMAYIAGRPPYHHLSGSAA
jgi:pyrroloquinoline-quinone synthase